MTWKRISNQGLCYQEAANLADKIAIELAAKGIRPSQSNLRIVHGIVTAYPMFSREFSHAWVEHDGKAYDSSPILEDHEKILPVDEHHKLMGIQDTKSYTYPEYNRMVDRHGHLGPFD